MDKIKNINEEIKSYEDIKKIVLKALRVIYSSSNNKLVLDILEGRKPCDLEDLIQDTFLKFLEGSSEKELYKNINHIIYKNRIKNEVEFALVVDDDNNANIDNIKSILIENDNAYISKNYVDISKFNLNAKQKEILNIYSKTNSLQKTADFLGISRNTVHTVLRRIKIKALEMA